MRDMQRVCQGGSGGKTAIRVDRIVRAGGRKGASCGQTKRGWWCSVWFDAGCSVAPALWQAHSVETSHTSTLPSPAPTALTKPSLITAELGVRRAVSCLLSLWSWDAWWPWLWALVSSHRMGIRVPSLQVSMSFYVKVCISAHHGAGSVHLTNVC